MRSQALLTLAAASTVSAHFQLNWPPTAGFVSDDEVVSPCGGATVNVEDSSPEVNVDRFATSLQSSHPTGNWQFRATLSTEEPYNWTNLSMVYTEGAGAFCLNWLSAPEDFAGNGGILQVIDYSGDGTLYQCAPVNFVSGSNETIGDACSNSTSSFTAEFTNSTESEGGHGDHGDDEDSEHDHSESASASDSASSTGDAAAAETSTAEGAASAATLGMGAFIGGLGALAAGLML